MTNETDHNFMKHCEALAAIAAERGESPVGSVVVLGGEIIGEGIEAGKSRQDVTFHAAISTMQIGNNFVSMHITKRRWQ